MTASADVPVSAELEAWARRRIASADHAALVAAYERGEVETLPAAVRGSKPASQSSWRQLQRGQRRPQKSPNRQRSHERRRRLALSGSLPGCLAGEFTTSDAAVLHVVAREHLRRGMCELSLDEIAARAGVCRKTVKRALRRAQGLRLLTIQERPLKGRKS